MHPEDQESLDDYLDGQGMLSQVKARLLALDGFVSVQPCIVLAHSVEHTFDNHENHQYEEQIDLTNSEMVKIDRLQLTITSSIALDSSEEAKRIEKDEHQSEEVPIEVVIARFDLVGIEGHDGLLILSS
jgi:hypothetical protein